MRERERKIGGGRGRELRERLRSDCFHFSISQYLKRQERHLQREALNLKHVLIKVLTTSKVTITTILLN